MSNFRPLLFAKKLCGFSVITLAGKQPVVHTYVAGTGAKKPLADNSEPSLDIFV